MPGYDRSDLVEQLIMSITSMRQHNKNVAIVVFVYGSIPERLGQAFSGLNVRIWQLCSYPTRLQRLCPRGAFALAEYPLLHKFLNFAEISSLNPSQVLLLDCDTYFLNDVDYLFQKFAKPDLVAREEVGSSRSYHGYDKDMIDEEQLAAIGCKLGAKPAPPFNLGIVLLNNGLWHKLAGLSSLHVNYAWRFMLWMAENPSNPSTNYGVEGLGVDLIRSNQASLTPDDYSLRLPYPSANRWILDEMSLWMTLGHLTGIRYKNFPRNIVLQNGEFNDEMENTNWIACHYFSQNFQTISNWLTQKQSAVN
jgi:hypothetical protein